MEKLLEEVNNELSKANNVSELLDIYQEINRKTVSSLKNAIEKMSIENVDDGR